MGTHAPRPNLGTTRLYQGWFLNIPPYVKYIHG